MGVPQRDSTFSDSGPNTIAAKLHERGWNYGYSAKADKNGVVWVADAHKGDQKARATAPTLFEALLERCANVEPDDDITLLSCIFH